MVLNVKTLLDPKSYYQKLKELAAKSMQVFSRVGSDVKKVFSAVHDGVSGVTASFGTFIKSVLRGGGALSLIEKEVQFIFSAFDAHMKNLKAHPAQYRQTLLRGVDQRDEGHRRDVGTECIKLIFQKILMLPAHVQIATHSGGQMIRIGVINMSMRANTMKKHNLITPQINQRIFRRK